MLKHYNWRLFWVICKPSPPENLFSDDEDFLDPPTDGELDPFSFPDYHPLDCLTGKSAWWRRGSYQPLLEEQPSRRKRTQDKICGRYKSGARESGPNSCSWEEDGKSEMEDEVGDTGSGEDSGVEDSAYDTPCGWWKALINEEEESGGENQDLYNYFKWVK